MLAIPTFALAVLSETIAVATETFATEAIVVIAALLSQTDPQEISCVDRSAATAVTAAGGSESSSGGGSSCSRFRRCRPRPFLRRFLPAAGRWQRLDNWSYSSIFRSAPSEHAHHKKSKSTTNNMTTRYRNCIFIVSIRAAS